MECEKCGGPMWDNRAKKASGEYAAKRSDFSCKDKDNCGHGVWLTAKKGAVAKPQGDRGSNGQPGAIAKPTTSLGPIYAECYAQAARVLFHYAKQYNIGPPTITEITAASATLFIAASQSGRPIMGPKEPPKPALPAKRSQDALDPYIDPDEVM